MATYSDDFNRANSGANAGWGANWQHYTGGSSSNTGWEILSNQGRVNASFTQRAALWNGGSVTNDQFSKAAIAALSVDGHAYVCVRATDDNNCYRGGWLNSSTVRLSKVISGTSTTLGSASVTHNAGDTVEVRASGTSISLYVNDVLQVGPITDSDLSSGRPGMQTLNTQDYDGWTGGDYGADAVAPVLTAPVANATAATTATVGATTDEANGTLYSVITTSSTQPSVAQIKAGQNHLGASATWSSNQAISSTGAKTFSVTGLTAGTMYFTYTVHADAAGNNSNVVASGFAAYDVSAASVTPATQSVALNATGSFAYTLNVTPATLTPTVNVVALTLSTPVPTATVTPATQNIVLAVTLPVTRAQALPLTQSVALNFSGVVAYTLNVTPASPTIAMQDVALNPSYPSAGGAGATTGRRNRRYSYALKYFSRG